MVGRRYWLPLCGAMTRKGTPCRRKPVLNPAGSIRNGRCLNHGGASTGAKSVAGRERTSAAAKAFWERYRHDKALGLPVPRVGRPKRQVATPSPSVGFAPETDEARRERILADLRRRFPERGF